MVWCPGTTFSQDELVVDNDADLLAVLRELDDPDWLERPRSYDLGAAAARFARLTARLEADFAASTTSEQDVQDSSEYGRVLVPAEATGRGTRIVVCVSKFGSLAVICAENPGAFFGTRDALAEGALDSADLATVHKALTESGYTVVPEELLESDYDGPSRLGWHVQRPTWSARFFGFY